jgi:arylsulfatase A
MRQLLSRSVLGLFALLWLTPIAQAQRQPNVIVIMADDLGYECIGANGCTSYKTPRLDALAAKGMRFTHCYVQPLCTPTRVQLMTGKYNVRNYIRFGHMDPSATTVAHLFKNAGYATCIVGKWQLGQDPKLPQKFGFDEHCLWQHTRRPPRYANPGLEINGKEIDFTKGEYGPDLVNNYALDFVTRKKDQPFFLYYPMILTHSPYQPTPDSPDWDPKAMGEKVHQHPKHFGEMVAYMDKLIGKLVDQLDSLKLRDNTLILFVGDNGTGVGVTTRVTNGVVHGGKGKMTSNGMHVPLILSWPGKIPAGTNNDLIDSTDILPTICAAARVEVPAKLKIDGQSFWPQARGEKGTPRAWFYSWYSRDGSRKEAREFAATHQFKLYRDGAWYDYQADPDEKSALPTPTSGEPLAAYRQLQSVLDQFKDARPAGIETKGNAK